jgi:hypothetical protein
MKELNDAIAAKDYERESHLHAELESIVAIIRDERAGSRERRRIVAAIKRSLEKIRKHDPILARVLGGALKTRGLFSYSPESTGLPTDAHDSESAISKPHRKG